MKKYLSIIVFVLFTLLLGVKSVFAIPSLQLYIPDATYYEDNPWFPNSGESWITTSNPFELQVAGATSPSWVNYIDNVKLYMALRSDEYLAYQNITTPLISIKDTDPNINLQQDIYASDFIFGLPSGLSKHGIYNTYYAWVNLPNLLVATAGETVYDYNKDFDPSNPIGGDNGDIQYYDINYYSGLNLIHFDLTGTIYDAQGKKSQDKFAPYSHDADTAQIPEPASLSLLGLGLLGLAGFRKKKAIS